MTYIKVNFFRWIKIFLKCLNKGGSNYVYRIQFQQPHRSNFKTATKNEDIVLFNIFIFNLNKPLVVNAFNNQN